MLSPLFDIESENYFSIQGWEMTSFQREAAALGEMSDFWSDVDQEAQTLNFVLPNNDVALDEADLDWSLSLDMEEHKDKLVHHDCMWAGSCGDQIHPTNNSSTPPVTVAPTTPRSLLRVQSPPRPETPPSLDEEEPPEFRHAVDVAGTAQRLLSSVVADHSYTLVKQEPKVQYDNLGVQTPSDSEEEIDVVSVGGDKLAATPGRADSFPRVPSAIDRHNIQNTVAYAMTPRQGAARKRLTPPTPSSSRTKRARAGRRSRRSPTDSDSDAESPEIERRSLHNDMERMRRIGLKNLFDELKDQIPAIKDKERAPKVVILREAASFCRLIQKEENEIETLKRQQSKLRTKLKRLRTQLASRYHQ